MAKAEVTDPSGVVWKVQRWWLNPWLGSTGLDILDFIIFIVMLPVLIAWPFWYASKWLGARWSIEIRRDGKKVAEERVRGWGKSGQRVAELRQVAAAGALAQQYPPEPEQATA
ncbi:MAG: hypothetical protein QOH57_1910 [Mycobacterium sp.]|nr:hypothetical protein [Mycobacterium sp.]